MIFFQTQFYARRRLTPNPTCFLTTNQQHFLPRHHSTNFSESKPVSLGSSSKLLFAWLQLSLEHVCNARRLQTRGPAYRILWTLTKFITFSSSIISISYTILLLPRIPFSISVLLLLRTKNLQSFNTFFVTVQELHPFIIGSVDYIKQYKAERSAGQSVDSQAGF